MYMVSTLPQYGETGDLFSNLNNINQHLFSASVHNSLVKKLKMSLPHTGSERILIVGGQIQKVFCENSL